jgi:hypothetical protein
VRMVQSNRRQADGSVTDHQLRLRCNNDYRSDTVRSADSSRCTMAAVCTEGSILQGVLHTLGWYCLTSLDSVWSELSMCRNKRVL